MVPPEHWPKNFKLIPVWAALCNPIALSVSMASLTNLDRNTIGSFWALLFLFLFFIGTSFGALAMVINDRAEIEGINKNPHHHKYRALSYRLLIITFMCFALGCMQAILLMIYYLTGVNIIEVLSVSNLCHQVGL